MALWGWILSILAGGATLIALVAGIFALAPEQIEKVEAVTVKALPVQLPAPPMEEPPPPPPEPIKSSPLADLAPEASFQSPDMGGVGFGGGGSGPAISGGGGFGSDTGALVRDRSSIQRPPRALTKSSPEYPADARSRGVSGFVILRILVAANGSVEDVKVQQSEPSGFFDSAAIKAVRSWRFEPAVQQGTTIAAWTTQRIKFELN